METPNPLAIPWSEADSQSFIERGRIVTPDREEILDAFLALIPAERDEAFLTVEIAVGDGWLSEAILDAFPRARILGLDGSPAMLRETAVRLQRFEGRFELQQFRLEDPSWLDEIGHDVRCFVSSLTIHHLDGPAKRALYKSLFEHLEERGAALILDLVAPRSERERRYLARAWDRLVEKQSLGLTGAPDVYRQFAEGHDNWYWYPDPMDMPSTIPEHLAWLEEAGFGASNVFWMRAGHALYGGYKGDATE